MSVGLYFTATGGWSKTDIKARKDAHAVKRLIVQLSRIVWRVYSKMAMIQQVFRAKVRT
jgi:hypothetical protein